VRYELEIRAIIQTLDPYMFAVDVSNRFISLIEERGFSGVNVERKYIREYHTSYAAHLLGYIGKMDKIDYEKYSKLDYPIAALVGKTGAERAFEHLLHGVDGERTIKTSDIGTVMDVVTTKEPEPGKHIYLTMDIRLQEAVEDALRLHIDSINTQIEEDSNKITGGAVVVTDVWSGEVLASASYPTFDTATLSQDFQFLDTDPTHPMLNRAAQGRYNPGSTFKMITAFAALREGIIGRWTPINDIGKYDRYESYQPTCWIYRSTGHGHGPLDVVQAIQQSCNYFFIYASDRLGSDAEGGGHALATVASEFGLGQKTGIEILESTGVLSTPEFKRKALNDGWWRADTMMTSFGQGHNLFTPLQLANYAATIANGGARYSLTLLRKTKSADFSEILYVHKPEAVNVIEEEEYVQILQEGMRAVTRTGGTAASDFKDYPIRVAAKTGTVQLESSDINNGVFVCYAPADNPQIAISVVVEKGVSGASITGIARSILDYYFKTETTIHAETPGELVP
jgi:penicillin-binding protein 2